jgi:tetratricopeptide (TPR) repeat protein
MQMNNKVIEFLKFPVFFIFFAFLVLCVSYNLNDADYFFHTKSGEYIVTHKNIPKEDIFSFSKAKSPWTNHEWFYQIVIYSLYKNWGIDGFFFLRTAVFCLAFLMLSIFALKTEWMFSFPLIFYGLYVSFGRFTLRPDNFSFLFFILFLLPFVFKKKWLLFLLPLIQVFWVNIHGFFFLGPVVLFLYLLLGKIKNKETDIAFYNTVKIIFVLTLLACFLTPQPISTIKYPLKILNDIASGNQKIFYKYIQELQSPFSRFAANRFFFSLMLFAFVCLGFFKKLNLFYIGLAITLAIFSLNSLRNMYFFVPVAIVIFVDRYPYIKDFLMKNILKETGFKLLKIFFIILAISFSVSMLKQLKNIYRHGSALITQNQQINIESAFLNIDPYENPKDMLDFIEKHKLPERMFNTFNIGAHLIFNFFPQRKVFIDGRADFYGPDFFNMYTQVIKGNESALRYAIKEYDLEGFIMCYFADAPSSSIKYINGKGFKCVYFGWDGIIFVKDDFIERNPSLKSFVVDFGSLNIEKLDFIKNIKLKMPYVKSYLDKAKVLYFLGYYEKSKEYLNEIIKIYPNNDEAYLLLAKVYYRQGDYEKAFMYCRDSLFFNPSLEAAHVLLAKIYIKTANLEDARREAEKYKVDFDKFLEETKNEKF